MDFRAARRLIAADNLSGSNLSGDLSMDPQMQDAHDPSTTIPHGDTVVHTDGADPASPGGPAPYNAAEPQSEPVVDDPLWQDQSPGDDGEHRGKPIPNQGPGTDEDKTTLHSARRIAYYSNQAGRSSSE